MRPSLPLLIGTASALGVTKRTDGGSNGNDCVLFGPEFPAASQLSGSKTLADAVQKFEARLTNSSSTLGSKDTAWAVALFSSKENRTLYEYYHTPSVDVGVEKVDKDSIFRIGSISKVFTVWSFLIEAGDRYYNEPITKYLPELKSNPNKAPDDSVYDDINNVQWDDVTIGQLASQAAGIPRESTLNELVTILTPEEISAGLGLAPLPEGDEVTCDIDSVHFCSREETIRLLTKQHPLYASQQGPVYSNIAFTLLSYAQEAIMGQPADDTVESSIYKPLGMTSSSFKTTPKSHGVIPGGNATEVGWDQDIGEVAPAGSMYASTADMVKAGQGILQSTLLSPAETRRWLTSRIQTGYVGVAVGAPWEMRYLTSPNNHVTDYYTKQGDIGTYNTAMALSPQHDLGWIAMAASAPGSADDVRGELFNAFTDFFIPMAEDQAKDEAAVRFAGTYEDAASNSSITIVAGDDGRAGLGVTSLFARGVEITGTESFFAAAFPSGEYFPRMYPSQLRTVKKTEDGAGTYDARLGFRVTSFKEGSGDRLEDPCLYAWVGHAQLLYGSVAYDDWVFEMSEDGNAEAIDLRMWRLKLTRVRD
ncbi:beta-lactamase/transpeptidase-like protein [Astrocystis sublimbata]|nr:beta-lactamase/transpeptidase-like protein [Astrocystis sublimbata]